MISCGSKLRLGYWWRERKEDGSLEVKESEDSLDIGGGRERVGGVMRGGDKKKVDNRVSGVGNEIRKRRNGMNCVRRELKSYMDEGVGNSDRDLSGLERKVNEDIGNKSNGDGVSKSEVGLGNGDNSCDGKKGVCSGEGCGIGDGKGGGSGGERCMNKDGGRKDNGD